MVRLILGQIRIQWFKQVTIIFQVRMKSITYYHWQVRISSELSLWKKPLVVDMRVAMFNFENDI